LAPPLSRVAATDKIRGACPLSQTTLEHVDNGRRHYQVREQLLLRKSQISHPSWKGRSPFRHGELGEVTAPADYSSRTIRQSGRIGFRVKIILWDRVNPSIVHPHRFGGSRGPSRGPARGSELRLTADCLEQGNRPEPFLPRNGRRSAVEERLEEAIDERSAHRDGLHREPGSARGVQPPLQKSKILV
jgi:hypothetical protein